MKSIRLASGILLFTAATSGAFACTTLGSYDDAWILAPKPAPAAGTSASSGSPPATPATATTTPVKPKSAGG